MGPDKFEIVNPSLSILAEPTVALVDKNVEARGTRKTAEAYLQFLYAPEGQALAAKNFYRPTKNDGVDAADLQRFADIPLVQIDKDFGGWPKAQSRFFDDGGVFDKIYTPKK